MPINLASVIQYFIVLLLLNTHLSFYHDSFLGHSMRTLIDMEEGMLLIMASQRTKLRTLIDMEEGIMGSQRTKLQTLIDIQEGMPLIMGSLRTNLRNRSLSQCFNSEIRMITNKFCFYFNCNLQIIFNYSTSFFHSQP